MDRTSICSVRLRDNAVPSVFPAFPSYLHKAPPKTRKPPKLRSPSPSSSSAAAGTFLPSAMSETTRLSTQPRSTGTTQPPTAADCCDTPRKAALKRKLSTTASKLLSSRKKIKLLQQSRRRLLKKMASLTTVISELRKNDLMSIDSLSVLEKSAGGVADLLKRQVNKQIGKPLPVSYSAELRSFALTLNFYSPRAYRYVRRVFDTCLPHPRTVERWYSSVDCKPGFTGDALRALEAHSSVAASKGNLVACALMMDEIAIRQKLEWDGSKYHGYIDFGTKLDDDSLPVAKEALTFMVVGINDNFKLPVGYFLIDGLDAMARSNLVNQCIEKLHSVDINVASLTFDGAASNLAMAKILGCNFDFGGGKFITTFPHPITQSPIAIFLDPCHMLKLVRNTLADKKSMVDGNDQFVNFEYIEKLHKLQQAEGLHFGNKLRSAHIAWYKKKMNVKLAAQLLSESVATSLEFCLQEKLPGFEGCEATIKFIRLFNTLFDLLNSRNLKSYGFKRPLQASNEADVKSFVSEARVYISSLKEARNGKNILVSNRKTGFLGFLICVESMLALYESLIVTGRFHMSFLCMFKISQDHLELFFGKIRSLGGCNNNPSARQFCAAYKKLLVHNDIRDVMRGNCFPLQSVPILTVSSSYVSNSSITPPSVEELNASVSRSRVLEPQEFSLDDHNYTYIPNPAHLSMCSQKIVAYIAGFVVYKLQKMLHCETCIASLTESNEHALCCLIKLKTKGALIFPSGDVIDICLTCEKFFRRNVSCAGSESLALSRVRCHDLIQSVLATYLTKPVFKSLSDHMMDCDPLANHVVLLVKAIAEKYLQVRYYYAGRQFTAQIHEKKNSVSRQVYTKLVIFSGQ